MILDPRLRRLAKALTREMAALAEAHRINAAGFTPRNLIETRRIEVRGNLLAQALVRRFLWCMRQKA